jgi:diguanylate cyclase (GGDEF)-like protein
VDTDLRHAVNQLSTGLGLMDCSSFELLVANPRLSRWLKPDCILSPIELLLPDIKVQRLKKVIEKNRKYRSKHEIEDNGLTLYIDFSFTKIQATNGDIFILIEGIQDDTKQEIDALINTYQETMENYKKQFLEQKELAFEADKAKAMALATMNEKLESQVKIRTQELELAKAELSHQANHDVLTGLANRRLFDDRLQHALELTGRNGKELALFYLDLDKFKQINDTLGHRIGDELLVQAATRLKSCTRKSDTVARMGGDEFSIIAENTTKQDAIRIAKKILSELTKKFLINDHELFISVSIGICLSQDFDHAKSSIAQAADAAMYQVKLSGKNDFCFYSAALISEVTNCMELEKRVSDDKN